MCETKNIPPVELGKENVHLEIEETHIDNPNKSQYRENFGGSFTEYERKLILDWAN